ncbi:hypothetical protein CTAM01_12547 [Colletotrichum tamarilloi]|uniref:Uncharacterized protein n=1 Tax=Colletotrichum tamarilloi TaxID=1209934 RepID=A0ABQ9QUH1_9PEZI|nr:uncharacterized protein CTAM01_12547 [Colletotrichum tamarilloi]KAK1485479.1 hypothetical protein CTAM01_12547 [Colletotrichum tamarilloi]
MHLSSYDDGGANSIEAWKELPEVVPSCSNGTVLFGEVPSVSSRSSRSSSSSSDRSNVDGQPGSFARTQRPSPPDITIL